MGNIREQWNEACLQAGIGALSQDTCAKIAAIVYVYGGENESVVHNIKLLADIRYIQKRFHLLGGERPDPAFKALLRRYVEEAESHKGDIPSWASGLMQEAYGIELRR